MDQKSIFITFIPVISDRWIVKGVGGSRLSVRGYGSIDFVVSIGETQQIVSVDKILYLPGIGTNLISVAAVTDVGLSVHFIEAEVEFAKGHSIVVVGERIGKNLYHLAIRQKLTTSHQTKESVCLEVPSQPSIAQPSYSISVLPMSVLELYLKWLLTN